MKNSVRWLPALVAPVLVIAGVVAVPAIANAASTPPTRTAQQVLALIAQSKDAAYSGTITQTSDLGLPQLPTSGPGSSSSGSDATSQLLDLLTADHTARVFVDGSSKQRLQVLDTLAERDVVHNGRDLWTYDSKKNTATHVTLPSKSSASTPTASPDATALTPAALAQKFITAITPSTKIAVSIPSTGVAGRTSYRLTLTPATGSTLVSRVVLSVDAQTGLPLRVVVDARGQKADAFSVGFTSVDFSTPAASTFAFTPPKGATVSAPKMPLHTPSTGTSHAPTTSHPTPTVSGSGWSTIVALPAGSAKAGGSTPTPTSSSTLLDELTTPVAGGRAIQTSLLSVLMLDDGRVLVGAVPIAALEAAAQ